MESLRVFRRPRSYEEAFEVHASREAIQAYIEKARKKQSEIQNELGWLEGLYLRRVEESPFKTTCSNTECRRDLHGYRGPLCRYCDGTAE